MHANGNGARPGSGSGWHEGALAPEGACRHDDAAGADGVRHHDRNGGAGVLRHSNAAPQVRRLNPVDRAAAAHIAREAFLGNRFYHAALGFGEREFAAYWDAFFTLALSDPRARAFGAEVGGALTGVLVACYEGFPSAARAARYLATLLWRIGPRATLRYLRFVRAYERAMHRPPAEHRREARGLWLMASPRAAARLGPTLLRAAVEATRAEGCTLYTGFVDAGDDRLLAFYRRQGFEPRRLFEFAGGWAAVVERRSAAEAPVTAAAAAASVRPAPVAEARPC